MPTGEGTHEQVSSPLREDITGVEGHPGGRDGWSPVEEGKFAVPSGLRVRNPHQVVVVPETGLGPPVVPSRPEHVDLIPAPRAVFVLPDCAGLGVGSHPLSVSMAEGEDLGSNTWLMQERVVRGDSPVLKEPDGRAGVVREVARSIALPPVPYGEVEVSRTIEDDPGSEVTAAVAPGVGHEKVLGPFQRSIFQATPGQCRGHTGRAWLGVGKVDPSGPGELGMQGHIQEAALSLSMDRRDPGDGVRDQPCFPHKSEATRALCDQNSLAVGKEGQSPGMLQSPGQMNDL